MKRDFLIVDRHSVAPNLGLALGLQLVLAAAQAFGVEAGVLAERAHRQLQLYPL